MKTFFLEKTLFLHHSFLIFPTFKVFCFSSKNLIIKAEKTFLRNITIWSAFCGKIATLSDFEKKSSFFSKNPSIFSKNTQILNILRNLNISVAFYGKFATIWYKKIHVQKREKTCRCGVNPIGKHRAKKKRSIWEEDFVFIFLRKRRKIISRWLPIYKIPRSFGNMKSWEWASRELLLVAISKSLGHLQRESIIKHKYQVLRM